MNISIIITTYNAAAYIIDTLQSIAAQSYQHFEVVIVDDGSIDETVKIVSAYITNNSSMKMRIIPVEHIGRAAALNYGVSLAQFDWIAIIDADDLWHKSKLAYQVKCIVDNNIDFVSSQSKLFSNNEDVNTNEAVSSNLNTIRLKDILLNQMLYYNLISHSSVLIKKNLVKYDEKRKSQIDYELFLRLLGQGVRLYLLEEPLVYHRIHPGQSFEAKYQLRYYFNATTLQLKYCFLHFKLIQVIFVISKLGYYILPRKLRLALRMTLFNSKSFKKI